MRSTPSLPGTATILLLGLLAGLVPRGTDGQTLPPADSARVRILLDSAEVALGMDAFGRLEGLLLEGEGLSLWTGQGASPESPTRRRLMERRTVVDFGRGRFYRKHLSLYPDGEPIFCSVAVADETSSYAYDCLSGVLEEQPHSTGRDEISAWKASRPHGWIELARSRADRITLGWKGEVAESDAGTGSEDPGGTHLLTLELGGVDRVLHLDGRTHLPTRVEWNGTSPLGKPVTRVLEFLDYRELDGWRFPFRLVYHNPGGPEQDLRYTRVRPLASPPDSAFLLPSDARIPGARDEGDAGPRIRRVARGAWEIREVAPDYNTMFVDTGHGVAVFDAPVGPEVAEGTLETIRRELPGREVRWVVPTHFHHDHVAGLAPFVEAGATVLTTGGNLELFRSLGRRSGTEPVVEVIEGRRVLGEGPGRVVLHAVDGAPHVDEMLLPHLPEADVIYVADLFWMGSDGLVRPADRETRAFRDILKRLGLESVTMVLSHGPEVGMAELRQAFRLARGEG